MPDVKFTLDPATPPKLTEAEAARLDAMTPAEIDAAAEADVDNPPLTEAELARMAAARLARRARERAKMTQAAFAAAFRLSHGRVRDLEQGRFQPDPALIAYLRVIERDPDFVRAALVEPKA